MVADTEMKISGWSSIRRVTTVPLPTAVGPESTVRRARVTTAKSGLLRAGRCGPVGELGDQRRGLVLAQAPQPPVRGDIKPLHDLGCPDCADPR